MGLPACDFTGNTPEASGNTPGNAPEVDSASLSALSGVYDITVWMPEQAGAASLTAEQIDAFEAANPGIIINASIESVSESEAAARMSASVEDGADLYCFTQDWLTRLAMAGAMNKLSRAAGEKVRSANDAGAVNAASMDGELYGFPLTSDNGYFMFYDKRVITDESHLTSLESLIADCEAAGKNFSYELEGSGWYSAGFFFAAGCKSSWTVGTDGIFCSVDDDFNSDKGIIAMRGMQKLLNSRCYVNSSSHAGFGAAVPSAVVVSGAWGASVAAGILGDGFGAAPLPSFEVDGQSYHLGSFSGNRLMGVKPQTDLNKAAVLKQLALYLSGEECQVQRFAGLGWCPSNLNAQARPEVQADAALSALIAQNAARSTCQGYVPDAWWEIAKECAAAAREADTDDTAALQAALDSYSNAVTALLSTGGERRNTFTVIGTINNTNWDVDFGMTEISPGAWQTEPMALAAGDEFKCRQGKRWDVSFGDGGNNFVVNDSGTYIIRLTVSGGNGSVQLIPV